MIKKMMLKSSLLSAKTHVGIDIGTSEDYSAECHMKQVGGKYYVAKSKIYKKNDLNIRMKRLHCLIFGHHFKTSLHRLSDQAVLVDCIRCNQSFAYNHVEKIILPYDIDMQEFYCQFNKIKTCRLTSAGQKEW